MAALSADLNCSIVGTNFTTVPLSANGADTFYKGALVYIDTGGGAQVTFGAGDIAIGYSPKNQVTTAAGDLVEVLIFGAIWLPVGTNIAAADEGDYLLNDGPTNTDNPADLVSLGDITVAAGDMICGTILRVTSTQMLIWVDPSVMGTAWVVNGTPANYAIFGRKGI